MFFNFYKSYKKNYHIYITTNEFDTVDLKIALTDYGFPLLLYLILKNYDEYEIFARILVLMYSLVVFLSSFIKNPFGFLRIFLSVYLSTLKIYRILIAFCLYFENFFSKNVELQSFMNITLTIFLLLASCLRNPTDEIGVIDSLIYAFIMSVQGLIFFYFRFRCKVTPMFFEKIVQTNSQNHRSALCFNDLEFLLNERAIKFGFSYAPIKNKFIASMVYPSLLLDAFSNSQDLRIRRRNIFVFSLIFALLIFQNTFYHTLMIHNFYHIHAAYLKKFSEFNAEELHSMIEKSYNEIQDKIKLHENSNYWIVYFKKFFKKSF